MKKLIMSIGVPGSGKTTIMKKFAEEKGYAYICPDDIRKEWAGNAADQSRNSEVWAEAHERLRQQLNGERTVVFDATFANQRQRKEFLQFARENGAEKIQGVFLDIPIELARERNNSRERVVPESAIDRMHKNLKEFPPEIDDGLDGLFYLDEIGELKEAKIVSEDRIIHREFGKFV